jgi:dimethylargininase
VFHFDSAIVRSPSRSVVAGLRADERQVPRYQRIVAEHRDYVVALQAAGLEVEVLPPLEAFPDSVFVEDPALVFAEGAVVLRPGAPSRAGEGAELAPTLGNRFERVIALPAGHVDGGDVLVTPDRVYIGLSLRTDALGARSLASILEGFGRAATIVPTPPGILHLKSAAALIDEETVLVTETLAAAGLFDGMRQLLAPGGEEQGANALRLNDVVLVGAAFPRTIDLLTERGMGVVPLDVSEVGKLDAGLSCLSLRWKRG